MASSGASGWAAAVTQLREALEVALEGVSFACLIGDRAYDTDELRSRLHARLAAADSS